MTEAELRKIADYVNEIVHEFLRIRLGGQLAFLSGFVYTDMLTACQLPRDNFPSDTRAGTLFFAQAVGSFGQDAPHMQGFAAATHPVFETGQLYTCLMIVAGCIVCCIHQGDDDDQQLTGIRIQYPSGTEKYYLISTCDTCGYVAGSF